MNALAVLRARRAVRDRRRAEVRARMITRYTMRADDDCAALRRDQLLADLQAGRARAGVR